MSLFKSSTFSGFNLVFKRTHFGKGKGPLPQPKGDIWKAFPMEELKWMQYPGYRIRRPRHPMILQDKVGSRKGKFETGACVSEMALMMSCWKENDYNQKACGEELKTFLTCMETAKTEKQAMRLRETKGVLPVSDMSPRQVSEMIKKYPSHHRPWKEGGKKGAR